MELRGTDLRAIRVQSGGILVDFAQDLGISPAELTRLETTDKPIREPGIARALLTMHETGKITLPPEQLEKLRGKEPAGPNRGNWLTSFRTKRGWTQSRVAEILDVSQPMVSMVERGTRKLPQDWRRKLLRAARTRSAGRSQPA